MKITADAYRAYTPPGVADKANAPTQTEEDAIPGAPSEESGEERAAILELSAESEARRKEGQGNRITQNEEAQNSSGQSTGEIKDESGRLTRQLVSAQSQDEVRTIVSEAFKNMGEARLATLSGDPKVMKKALAIIKRLNKLISRSYRKLKDLDKEDGMRQKAKRAERREDEAELRRLRAELQRHINERKMRERKYLRDAGKTEDNEDKTDNRPSPAELQAQFFALQQALNELQSAELSAVSAEGGAEASIAAGGEGGEGNEGSVAGGEGGAEGGGETAVGA